MGALISLHDFHSPFKPKSWALLFHYFSTANCSLCLLACPLATPYDPSLRGSAFTPNYSWLAVLLHVFSLQWSQMKYLCPRVHIKPCQGSDVRGQLLLSAFLVNLRRHGTASAEREPCKLLPTLYTMEIKPFVFSKWNWHVFITLLITSSLLIHSEPSLASLLSH